MISVIIPTIGRASIADLFASLKGQPYDELIVELSDKQPTVNRNNGLKRANGDIIVFLDDDIIVARNFIVEGKKNIYNYDFGQSRVVGGISNSKDIFIGAAMWFKRSTLDAINGFDENIPFFNEDIDVYLRAKKANFSYGFFDKSIAFHPGMGTFEKLVEGNKILKEKYPEEYEKLAKELR